MKTRRNFLKNSLLATGLTAPCFGQSSTNQKPIKGNFIHVVLFWLNDAGDAENFIESSRKFLDQVREINHYHLGTPADTDRPIIEKSYNVCLVVTFDSKREHDIYQEHSAHKKYIEDNSHRWERVMIIDSVS